MDYQQKNHEFNNWENSQHSQSHIKEKNTWIVVGQILTIISAAVWCFTLIGMIWGIPMILGCVNRLNHGKKITVAHIVISIIFFGWIGGLLTLFGSEQQKRSNINQ